MKKKIIVLAILGSVFFGGTAGALAYHIADAAAAKKESIDKQFSIYMSEKDQKIKNDVSTLTLEEIERLNSEVDSYFNLKAGQDYNQDLNQKTNEIYAATDQHIKELHSYIDTLFNNKKD